jgi:hypothetical protein
LFGGRWVIDIRIYLQVKVLEDALDPDVGWARDLDFVLWIDADMIILDMRLRVEQIAAQYPSAHILVSAEHAGITKILYFMSAPY